MPPFSPSPSHLILLCFALLLGACATTHVEESWKLPEYKPAAQQKVLVVAMAANETVRKAFEASFVKQLDEKNVVAIASNQWIPDSTAINRDSLRPILAQNGITTVLVSSIRGIEKIETYQAAANTGPNDNLFRNFDTYQVYSSSGQHETGNYEETTDYLLETNLFDTRKEKLSWSVSTRTTNAGSLKKAVEGVVSSVIKQATEDKVF